MLNSGLALFGIIVAAYLIGSIPFGLLIGGLKGVNIRQHGSGNIGATNVTRVIGRKWGIFCFCLDFCKGLVPVILAKYSITDFGEFPAILAGAAAISGHVWPVFLRFKGGKGMATSLGALIAIAPWHVAAAAIIWFLVFKISCYVSLASIIAAATLPLPSFFIKTKPEILTFLIIIAILVIIKHRSNINRLIRGKENRFERKRKNFDENNTE